MTKWNYKNRAFTLVEMEVAMAVFSLVIIGVVSFVIYIYKTERYSLSQLEAVNRARRSLESMSDDIRNIRDAEGGPNPIDTADSQTLIFYSDIDDDGQTEKVRYFLDNEELKKGVIEPPYTGAESISVVISSVANNSDPIFSYYDEDFTGTQAALVTPADVMDVKLIKMTVKVDKNENISPPALTIETYAQPRNLKEN